MLLLIDLYTVSYISVSTRKCIVLEIMNGHVGPLDAHGILMIYVADSEDPNSFIDQKNRGANGSSKGHVSWPIDNLEHHFTEGIDLY